MSTFIAIRDAGPTGPVAAAIASADMSGIIYSPAKEKAATRGLFVGRPLLIRRVRTFIGAAKLKLVLCVLILSAVVLVASKLSSVMVWVPLRPDPTDSRGSGYTVLINTWKRSSALKQSVSHYAACDRADEIQVVWSDGKPPS